MELNQNQSVTEPVASGAATETTQDNEAALSKAQADYKRDMLRYKDELTAAQEKLKAIELEQQEKKGNLEGVISSLKDEIKNLKHQNASMKLNFADTQIESAVKAVALERGIKGKKLDLLMRVIDENDKGAVELDSAFRVNADDAKALVEKQMERYADVFTKSVKVVDGVPGNKAPVNTPKKLDTDKMTPNELRQYIIANADKLT